MMCIWSSRYIMARDRATQLTFTSLETSTRGQETTPAQRLWWCLCTEVRGVGVVRAAVDKHVRKDMRYCAPCLSNLQPPSLRLSFRVSQSL